MSNRIRVSLKINGSDVSAEVEPRKLLVDFIREDAGLTGTHIGCDTSNCGACTVMLNGKTVKSCSIFAVAANGGEILTIEGMADKGKLHPIQEAFIKYHGLQCGYCTPGMILSSYYLLSRNPSPTEEEIRYAISGNICRCTGYQNIVRAVQSVVKE